MLLKAEFKKLNLHYGKVNIGEADIFEDILP
jgi:hypothetical protein